MLAELSQRVRCSPAHFGIGIINELEQLGHCPRRAIGGHYGHYEHINASLSDSGMLTVEGRAQIWDDTLAQAGQRAGGTVCRWAARHEDTFQKTPEPTQVRRECRWSPLGRS